MIALTWPGSMRPSIRNSPMLMIACRAGGRRRWQEYTEKLVGRGSHHHRGGSRAGGLEADPHEHHVLDLRGHSHGVLHRIHHPDVPCRGPWHRPGTQWEWAPSSCPRTPRRCSRRRPGRWRRRPPRWWSRTPGTQDPGGSRPPHPSTEGPGRTGPGCPGGYRRHA